MKHEFPNCLDSNLISLIYASSFSSIPLSRLLVACCLACFKNNVESMVKHASHAVLWERNLVLCFQIISSSYSELQKGTSINQVPLSLFSSLCPTIVSPLFSCFSRSRLAKIALWAEISIEAICWNVWAGFVDLTHYLAEQVGMLGWPAVWHTPDVPPPFSSDTGSKILSKNYTHTNWAQRISKIIWTGKSASVRRRNLTHAPYWNN